MENLSIFVHLNYILEKKKSNPGDPNINCWDFTQFANDSIYSYDPICKVHSCFLENRDGKSRVYLRVLLKKVHSILQLKNSIKKKKSYFSMCHVLLNDEFLQLWSTTKNSIWTNLLTVDIWNKNLFSLSVNSKNKTKTFIYMCIRLAPGFQHYLFLNIWKTHYILSNLYLKPL